MLPRVSYVPKGNQLFQIDSASTSSQLLVAFPSLKGMLRRVMNAPHMKAMHAMNMQTYTQGLITSMKLSASANDGILLNITAEVLFTQCMSIVSFNEPVL